MRRELTRTSKGLGLAMIAALAAGTPAATMNPKDPVKQATEHLVRDVLKGPGLTRRNGRREWKRVVEAVYLGHMGEPMSERQWKLFQKVFNRGWCPRHQEGSPGIKFFRWLVETNHQAEAAAPPDFAAQA